LSGEVKTEAYQAGTVLYKLKLSYARSGGRVGKEHKGISPPEELTCRPSCNKRL